MNRCTRLIVAGILSLAVLTVLLSFHRSYSPGPVLEGHQPFNSNCAACHQPWGGVALASTGCIACHGNMVHNSDHRTVKLDDKDDGLDPGMHVAGFNDHLACLSCHTDHKGRKVDFTATSGTSCSRCHAHDSIAGVGAHGHSLRVQWKQFQNFAKDFSHKQHLEDALKHLQEAKENAKKMRSPARKQAAEKAAAELASVLDRSGQHLNCRLCHLISPPSSEKPEEFAIVTTGCTVSTCHSSWQDEDLKLANAEPVTPGQSGSPMPEPATIPFVESVVFRPINAIFVPHSAGHLSAECTGCHLHMEDSEKPHDSHTREIAKCFECHAHEAGTPAAQVATWIHSSGILSSSPAEAGQVEVLELPKEKPLNACADCHAFHSYYRGGRLIKDFPSKAPTTRPHQSPEWQLAAYTISVHGLRNGSPAVTLRRVTLRPWWIALLALLMMTLIGVGYLRYLPPEMHRRLVSNSGPQRTPEIPELDDTYESNVPRLYVAGEASGRTSSINFVMRSGRQVIEAIAGAIRHEKRAVEPEVYDVAIVGCGPTGIGAAWSAKSNGLNYLALEKDTAASTIRTYPRGKFVQATPIELQEFGSFYLEGDRTKEELVEKWEEMLRTMQLQINEREEVISINRAGESFEIATQPGKRFKARYVVLAIGTRGAPRKLRVESETADRVFYNLIDPEEFKDKRVLVVGGGNSGAEVTQLLADPALRNTVSYSFRDAVLSSRVSPENAAKISDLQQRAQITVYPLSHVTQLKPGKVVLAPMAESSSQHVPETTDQSAQQPPRRGLFAWLTTSLRSRKTEVRTPQTPSAARQEDNPSVVRLTDPIEIENDFVFAMQGADLPTAFMKSIGIRMTRKGF
jgi:thioredoxin reductase